MRKTVSLTLFLSLFFYLNSQAQNLSDTLGTGKINNEYLEKILKKGIDSMRLKRNRKGLSEDKILYKAAKDHANYLREKKKLSHEQKDKEKRNPGDRVRFYGGGDEYESGENVLTTLLNTSLKNNKGESYILTTYQDLRDDILRQWKASPAHYTNMSNKDYSRTGLAVSYDIENQTLYVVQVFAKMRNE